MLGGKLGVIAGLCAGKEGCQGGARALDFLAMACACDKRGFGGHESCAREGDERGFERVQPLAGLGGDEDRTPPCNLVATAEDRPC